MNRCGRDLTPFYYSMIDLNKRNFVKDSRINKEAILRHIHDEAIFRYYIPELRLGAALKSPLKQKDDHPSFGVYHSNKYNILMFKDQSLNISGDCFEFVKRYFRLNTIYEACTKIALDFNITGYTLCDNIYKNIIPPSKSVFNKSNYKKERTIIDIQSRKWEKHDSIFWGQFGIKISTLNKFKVKPLRFIFINGIIYTVDKHAYAYEEIKDRVLSYKIYQPYSNSKKWLNNATACTHQGYISLPKRGELLIITKSLKDVMSIYDVADITSVALQNESILIKPVVMDEYIRRFEDVICLFDRDRAGKALSEKYKDSYKLNYILIPEKFKLAKDFSDLVKYYGIKNSKNILKNIINDTKSSNNSE